MRLHFFLGLVGLASLAGAERPTRAGLGLAFHAGRRAALIEKLDGGVLVLRGLPATRDYQAFHQDKTFWYLTGVESHDAALVIDIDAGREILFLPTSDPFQESWDGEMWDAGDKWVRELTGIEDVRASRDLPKVLGQLLERGETAWISLHPQVALAGCFDRAAPHDRGVTRDPLDGRPSREVALKQRLEELYGAKVRDVAPILSEMRRVKTAEEIAAMRRAAHAGALGMIEAMRSTRPGLGEWELEGLMSFVHLRQGAAGPAYHGIVGSGPNSLVLHYSATSRRLEAGESLLIDYGPAVDHYTTDITRTWPTDGRYSERMAELYDAVLAAQAAGIAAASPGRRIRDVERACSEVLRKRGLAGLVRHGSCHYIGMEVHDVGEREAELVPGVAFTIEPGVYEPQTGIGIRIEDVVVITAEGCEVITSEVPRERAAIEALIAEEGVLDWLDSERGR
jgi:Xaa-Pro aminopeptidase